MPTLSQTKRCAPRMQSKLLLAAVLFSVAAAAQSTPQNAAQQDQARTGNPTAIPQGITSQQADAILQELKAIHQLLDRQQSAAAPPEQNPASDKVTMSVSEGWYALGRDDAPVTVVEFSDYQCPFCRKFHSDSFIELKKNYIDTGKVRFVSRDLPLDFHPNSAGAAAAARCAGEQGKFWEMRDLMLASASDLSPPSIAKYGAQLGLDSAEFSTCISDAKYAAAIKNDAADAAALGIGGTPSFVVARTAKGQINGVRIVGAVPYSVFDTAIKNQLNPSP